MAARKLTARTLATLKPVPGKRVDLFDAHSPGLAIRVSEAGVKTWVLMYRTQPDPETQKRAVLRRLTLGRYPDLDLKAARKRAAVERGKVAKGHDPAAAKQELRRAAKRSGDTVADLSKDFISKYAKVQKRSWRDDQRYLDAEVLPAWKHRKVRELTRRDVRELIEGIADRGSPVSANRCLALVRKMLNWAVEKDWIDGNPAALFKKPGAETSRERVLSDAEIRLVWAACEGERPAMCALMRLRFLTAQRGAEVAAMRWQDLDLEAGWWAISGSATKNKRSHRVPLTPAAIDILKGLPQIEDCDWVFPGRTERKSKPVGDAKKAGGRIAERVLKTLREQDPTVETFDFRGHDLRRTASTKMREAGVPRADIARVLNHVEGGPRATHVYDRYEGDREKRIALETWARVLAGILEPRPAASVIPITRG